MLLKRTKVYIAVAVAVFWLLLSVHVIGSFIAHRSFEKSYKQLRVGLNRHDVYQVFSRPPDGEFFYLDGAVLIYCGPALFDQTIDASAPKQIHIKEYIPHPYGATQLLFDKEARLVAFSQVGEESSIHTSEGDYPGSQLKQLSEQTLDRLVSQQ
jgi:hypothetical protein